MDDNARLQRARVVTDYLENETIERMDCPSLSPDLNTKEHAWDKLQQAISARPEFSKNPEELSAALVEEWARLPPIFFWRLIRNM
jgi:transposase